MRSRQPRAAEPELADLVRGNAAFAFDLYRSLAQGEGNLFYSPHSVSLALAMTYAGARGETERQRRTRSASSFPKTSCTPLSTPWTSIPLPEGKGRQARTTAAFS